MMIREINRVEIMEEACKYTGVRLQEIFCYVLEEDQLYIRGSIYTQENYQVKGNLQIRADVITEDGKVAYSMEDYQKRNIEFLYDSFELNRYDACRILKAFDLEKCTIRVYPIIRADTRRESNELSGIY